MAISESLTGGVNERIRRQPVLLSARTGLIARDELNYKQDLKLVRDLLTRHFDPKAKVNSSALATVKQLAENPVSIAPPDINNSLNAIRAARVARERPTR